MIASCKGEWNGHCEAEWKMQSQWLENKKRETEIEAEVEQKKREQNCWWNNASIGAQTACN